MLCVDDRSMLVATKVSACVTTAPTHVNQLDAWGCGSQCSAQLTVAAGSSGSAQVYNVGTSNFTVEFAKKQVCTARCAPGA
jgi:hypothetical protein